MWLNRFQNESFRSQIKHLFKDFFFYWRIRKHPVHQIPSYLESLSQALNKVAIDTEPHFLRIGEALQEIYLEANELTRKIMHMIKQISGDYEESVIAKVADLAKNSVWALQNHQTEIPNNLRHISRIIESLGMLLAFCGRFDRLNSFLRVIAVNIGVESARSHESRDLFTVVAQETKRLAENIKEISERLHDDAMLTQFNQKMAHRAISDGLDRLNGLADEGEKALDRAVKEIEQIMKSAMKSLRQAQQQSQEISKQVGEIVMGIQLHDSMRQRIEHIIRSFMDIDRLYKGYESNGGSRRRFNSRLGTIHSIVSIQTAQIKQIIEDVNSVYVNNIQAFEGIGRMVEQLVENVSEKHERHIGSLHLEESFQTLQAILKNLAQLLWQGQKLVQDMRLTAKQASEAAGRLSTHMDHVHEIGFEMRIKALNAIIKAAHLEEGQTQEALAQSMREHSNQSNAFASKVIETLQFITNSAQWLIAQTEDQRQEDQPDSAGGNALNRGTGASLEDGIQDVANTFTRIKDSSSETSNQLDALKQSISKTREDHQFMRTLSNRLTIFQTKLEQMVNQLSPWAIKEHHDVSSWISRISNHYTMDKERSVHDQYNMESPFTKNEEKIMPNDAIVEQTEQDLEGDKAAISYLREQKKEEVLGDNVELF